MNMVDGFHILDTLAADSISAAVASQGALIIIIIIIIITWFKHTLCHSQ